MPNREPIWATTARSLARLTVAAAIVGLSTPRAAAAQAGGDGGWRLRFAPYVQALRIDGNWALGPVAAPADPRFGNAFCGLTVAGGIYLEGGKGRWSAIVDGALVRSGGVPEFVRPVTGAAQLSLSSSLLNLELLGTCRLGPQAGSGWLELLGGARYTAIAQVPSASGGATDRDAGLRKAWVDPLVGFRIGIAPHHRMRIVTRGDVGGFGVGADLTWGYSTALVFRLTRVVELGVEYRIVDVDYVDGESGASDSFVYDGTTHSLTPRLTLGL